MSERSRWAYPVGLALVLTAAPSGLGGCRQAPPPVGVREGIAASPQRLLGGFALPRSASGMPQAGYSASTAAPVAAGGDVGLVRPRRSDRPTTDAAPQPKAGKVVIGLVMVCAFIALLLLPLGLLLRNRQLRDAQRATLEAERRWVMALDGAGDGVWDWNPRTNRVFFSRQWKRMLGYDDGDIGDRPEEWTSRVHPDDLPLAMDRLRRHLKGETPSYRSVHRLRNKQGAWRWILNRGMVFERDRGGRAVRVVGTHTDITRLRRTEAALAAEQELFAAVVSQASDGVVVIDAETLCFVQFNDTACHVLGYERGEFEGLTLADIQAELSLEQVREQVTEIVAEGRAEFDALYRRKDGSRRSMRVSHQVIVRDGRSDLAAIWVDITDRLAAERALAESERRFRSTFDHAAVGIAQVATDGRWLRINQRLCEIVGYTPEELLAGRFQDITYPDDVEAELALVRRCLAAEIDHFRLEKRYVRKDGRALWADLTAALVRRDDGTADYFISVIDDVDQRKRDQAELEKASLLYRGLIENMRDGVAIYDAVDDGADFVFRLLNPAGARSTRLRPEDAVGRRVRDVFPQIDAVGLLEVFRRVYRSGRPESHATTHYRDERVSLWVENHVFKLPGSEIVAVFADVSAQKAAEEELQRSRKSLERMAYYDALTGLPNRRLLLDRLRQVVAIAERSGSSVVVCYLDLDDFKPVNDRLGHTVGDALLQAVAERLGYIIRRGDTVARWGGDEFALLLTGLDDHRECEQMIQRLLHLMASPYNIDTHELTLSASIGVTVYPRDDSDGDALLRHADHAMYLAKQRGRNTYCFFDPDTDGLATAKRDRLQRIRAALDDAEFRLLYQPIVDMRQGRVDAVEALVRWEHPQLGLLLPGDFLPDIDGTALVGELDLWVLRQALADLAGWIDQGLSLRLHVNVAAYSLTQIGLLDQLAGILDRHPGVKPEQVTLELREDVAVDELQAITRLIDAGRALGLCFALDDFGTGVSSLTYFRHLPVQLLKIDQSFVRGMLRDKDDLRIVEAIIGLSRAFNRIVVGEGVESEAHGMMLLRFGCELGQGYGIARAMPREQLVGWIERYRQPRQWRSVATRAWLPDDLPLLAIETEHRRWIEAVTRTAAAEADRRPPLVPPQQCPLGRWYAGDGQRQYGQLELFRDLAPLHERVHEIAAELLRTEASGTTPEPALLEQLASANDVLLDRMTMLQNAVIDRIGEDPEPGPGADGPAPPSAVFNDVAAATKRSDLKPPHP